jgi:hypothetical protein
MKTIPFVKLGKSNGKYGVTERKKAELDALSLKVLDAQQQVNQFQSIVASLTTKLNNFQAQLAINDTNRAAALTNQTLVDQLVQSFLDLQNNSSIAFNEMAEADVVTNQLASSIKVVMNKLIYTADMINKLAANVARKKAMNPLISDELVSMLTTAGSDANNAVALTLVALQTAFAAQSSNTESQAATGLEYVQAMDVYQLITGTDQNGSQLYTYTDPTGNTYTGTMHELENTTGLDPQLVHEDAVEIDSLQYLLHQAYTSAKESYAETQLAIKLTSAELNQAQISLDAATVSLQSLQAGLAAGNAAALAS